MKKAILTLLCLFAVMCCAEKAQTAPAFSSSASTSGWGDETATRALAEEFAKCSAFNDIAAGCVKNATQAQQEKVTARYEDVAKRFYKGSYMLVGQDFTRQRIRFHDTSMRRSAGNACEGFSKLEQQYRKRCDDAFKRLPHKLQ
jgi:hypothetical protein